MAKRTDNKTEKQFTTRIHKQHSSLVITVPQGLCKMLNWSRGDVLLFETDEGCDIAIVGKTSLKVRENVRNNRNTDRQDKGGAT